MKLLFSPAGLVLLAVVAAILFAPRRSIGLLRRLRKPMRAFDDADISPPETGSAGATEAPMERDDDS